MTTGLDLQRAWEQALTSFGAHFRLVRIGLTGAQVDALANARLREGIEVKPSDSRSQTYLAEHGDRCWEVDILPATVIEQALDAHIRSWLDERLLAATRSRDRARPRPDINVRKHHRNLELRKWDGPKNRAEKSAQFLRTRMSVLGKVSPPKKMKQ